MVNTSSQYKQQPGADSSVDSNGDWIDNVCSSTTFLFPVPKSQPAQALEAKSDHVFEGLERGLNLPTDRPRDDVSEQQKQKHQIQRKWEQPNKADKSPASASASTTPPGRVRHNKLDTDLLDSVFERIESFTCRSPTGELVLLAAAPPDETAPPNANRGRTHIPQTKETTRVNGEYLTKENDLETLGVPVRDSKSMVKPAAGSAIRIVSYSNGKSMDASIQGMYLLGVTVVLAMIVTGIFLIARSVW